MRLETGDLVFLDLDCGPSCEAIEAVTREQFNVEAPSLSHVGLVVRASGGRLMLLEAWPASESRQGGVILTPLSQALARTNGRRDEPGGFYLLRLEGPAGAVARQAALAAHRRLGAPYDEAFLPDNGRYYCSELVQVVFAEAAPTDPLFQTRPMTFGRPGTLARRFWEAYFHRLGQPVPEGVPGISPLGLFLQARAAGARSPR